MITDPSLVLHPCPLQSGSIRPLGQWLPKKLFQENNDSFLPEVCQSLTVRIGKGRELGRAGPGAVGQSSDGLCGGGELTTM